MVYVGTIVVNKTVKAEAKPAKEQKKAKKDAD